MVQPVDTLRTGDTIAVDGDQLVVFHLSHEYGEVVIDAVSAVSARRYELHYPPEAPVSVV